MPFNWPIINVAWIKASLHECWDQLVQPGILFVIGLIVFMWLLGSHLKRLEKKIREDASK